jgi:hypothetical protein
MKHNKKIEKLFLFRKLTDISKQYTIFVKDVDAPTDCIGSRNTSGANAVCRSIDNNNHGNPKLSAS